ncbi:hypothetical protein LVD15_26110 [Fulvivirga maritima]|uniref:hypothetical protein n=1 Tax=Fulvivirga maritima TaxID=2904247 RepID=UPI001F31EAF8|nr:hypothetical protein [Fulvivirga maritima]UII26729.1 hypothetical protein LVD15_26110 [Fulvivirga maritima]
MGGMLHPTTKGKLDGQIEGLNSSGDITSYVLNKGQHKLSQYNSQSGYLVGFGAGFENGQKLRTTLKEDVSCKLPFSEKVKCLSFLLEQQLGFREDYTQIFIDNLSRWEETDVANNIKSKTKSLLQENKIQRSVDTLILHFKEHYQLKSLMEFYPVYDKLKRLRKEKKHNKAYSIYAELEALKNEIKLWVE